MGLLSPAGSNERQQVRVLIASCVPDPVLYLEGRSWKVSRLVVRLT